MMRQGNSRYLSQYMEARQQKKERNRRVSRSPESLRLRNITLDRQQVERVSATATKTWHDKNRTARSAGRASWMVSIGLHAVLALIVGIFLVSQVVEVTEHTIVTDLYHVEQTPPPKRRIPPRLTNAVVIDTPSPAKQVLLPVAAVTFARVPVTDAVYALPTSSMTANSNIAGTTTGISTGIQTAERKMLRGLERTQFAVDIPRTTPPSVLSAAISVQAESIEPDIRPTAVTETPVVTLSDVTRAPRFLRKVLPDYPDLARRAEREGIVWLEASIELNGTVSDIRVIRGIGYGCDEAAVEALRTSRFQPAQRGGEMVAVRIQVPYRFVLDA